MISPLVNTCKSYESELISVLPVVHSATYAKSYRKIHTADCMALRAPPEIFRSRFGRAAGTVPQATSTQAAIDVGPSVPMRTRVLLVGRTGVGKSTIANCILDMDPESATRPAPFSTSASSLSKTRQVQMESFVHGNTTFQIVDTIGFGDTSMSERAVADSLVRAVGEGGVNPLFGSKPEGSRKKGPTFRLYSSSINGVNKPQGNYSVITTLNEINVAP